MLLLAIISAVLLLMYAWLIGYYHRAWKQLPLQDKIPEHTVFNTLVTVIIPARNEAGNIRACIESYLQQDYPPHLRECIIVDDFSKDATAEIVLEYAAFGVKLIQLEKVLPNQPLNAYKKKAIETAVSDASGELLLTTDADCLLPASWISQHVYFQQRNKLVFVAAPVRISPSQHWLTNFQALDFISLQGITGASHQKGLHAMCNGANLSYTREAFLAVNGFSGIDHLASGDDMFLMQKIAARYPNRTGFLKSERAIVQTAPMPDIQQFLQQRIRWASKATAYKEWSIKLILALVYSLNLLLLVMLVACLLQPGWWLIGWGLVSLKALIEWPFMYSVGAFFSASRLVAYFPLYQPLHIVYTVAAGAFGQIGTYHWKDRKVR